MQARASEGDDRDAHVEGLAGGCGARIGEGVQRDVHESIGCQMVRVGRCKWQQVHARSIHPRRLQLPQYMRPRTAPTSI